MQTRKNVVRFIQNQLNDNLIDFEAKHDRWHYGLEELRKLLDFIYEEMPNCRQEELVRESEDEWYKENK